MDFTPTEAQHDLAGLTRGICDKLVTADRLKELDAAPGRVDEELHRALADAGVYAAALPEPVGGGFGVLEQAAIQRELGRALATVPYLPSIVMAAAALAEYGSPEQRELAGRAAAGEIVLTAALEEPLVADPHAPVTLAAEAGGDGWVLDGVKTAVPYACEAAALLVPARLGDPSAAAPRTGVFLVPADDVRVTRQDGTDRGSIGEVVLDGVRVPSRALLGAADGDPGRVLGAVLERAAVGVCAEQSGVLERALDVTAAYAREREQFGRPIGSFQAVAQRLADAYIDVQAARLTCDQAAWRLAEGLPAAEAVRVAKFWAADAGHRVAHTVIHVHGGVGLDREHPVHRYFLAAKRGEFTLGSATAQLAGIGAGLAG